MKKVNMQGVYAKIRKRIGMFCVCPGRGGEVGENWQGEHKSRTRAIIRYQHIKKKDNGEHALEGR
jgi:hypothetical protein